MVFSAIALDDLRESLKQRRKKLVTKDSILTGDGQDVNIEETKEKHLEPLMQDSTSNYVIRVTEHSDGSFTVHLPEKAKASDAEVLKMLALPTDSIVSIVRI